jgi:TRAP-type transport system small permease protein
MQKVADSIHRVTYYIGMIGVAIVLVMMLLTVCDVIGRAGFRSPIPGTYELSKYLLVMIVLLGLGHAEHTGNNIRVDLFIDKFSFRTKTVLDIIFTVLAFVFCLLIAWQGWDETLNSLRVGTNTDILHIPEFPFRFLIAFGCFLLAVELALKFIRLIAAVKKGIEVKA